MASLAMTSIRTRSATRPLLALLAPLLLVAAAECSAWSSPEGTCNAMPVPVETELDDDGELAEVMSVSLLQAHSKMPSFSSTWHGFVGYLFGRRTGSPHPLVLDDALVANVSNLVSIGEEVDGPTKTDSLRGSATVQAVALPQAEQTVLLSIGSAVARSGMPSFAELLNTLKDEGTSFQEATQPGKLRAASGLSLISVAAEERPAGAKQPGDLNGLLKSFHASLLQLPMAHHMPSAAELVSTLKSENVKLQKTDRGAASEVEALSMHRLHALSGIMGA